MRLPLPNKSVAGFFVRVVACYALSIVLWHYAGPGYGMAFRTGANKVFARFGWDVSAQFLEEPPARGKLTKNAMSDIYVKIRNLKTGYARWALSGSSRYTGYVPTAVCLSLILSTPVQWRRRLLAAGFGLLLIHLAIILRWSILLVNEYSAGDQVQQFALGPWGKGVVKFLVDPVCASVLFPGFVVPAVVWVAVTFRRSDGAWLKDVPMA